MMTSFDDAPTSSPRLEALTKVAFVLLLTLPVVRVTMLEILRDPFDISPGSAPVPRGPGATTTVLLNMLCMLPMLLTLARAALDRGWRLRFNWSHLPLALLAGWTVLSAAWAHDRFAAVVTGTTFLSAAAMLWAAGQLVRSWGNFRLVTSVGVGLLGVFLAYGVAYRTVEFPDLQRSWQLNKQQILRERGWDEDSFSARQFAKRVESGELAGFSASPNTFGAVLVLVLVVSIGLGVQRARDDGRAWWVFVIGAGAVGAWLLVHTGSRTAMLTPFIALGILLFAWLWKRLLPSRLRGAFWVGVLLFLLGAGALIGHGLYHGTLFHDSLTFRWKYWVGSMRVFEQHPWLGVVVGGLHHLLPQVARAQLAVNPESAAVGLCHCVSTRRFLRHTGFGLVQQLGQAIALHCMHEGIGHTNRDVEVLQSSAVLGVDELLDIRVVTAQHGHLRAAPRTGRFHGFAGAVEDVHVADRPRGTALGAADPGTARADAREVITNTTAFAHGLGGLRKGGVDAGVSVLNVRDRVANRLHEAVDQRSRQIGPGSRLDTTGRQEAGFERLQETCLPMLLLSGRLGQR